VNGILRKKASSQQLYSVEMDPFTDPMLLAFTLTVSTVSVLAIVKCSARSSSTSAILKEKQKVQLKQAASENSAKRAEKKQQVLSEKSKREFSQAIEVKEVKDNGLFYAHNYPLPNMLVQQGTHVEMHSLQSTKGQLLNGKPGIAREFFGHGRDSGRWSVDVEGCSSLQKFKIENLVFRGDVDLVFLGDAHPSGMGGGHSPVLAMAGTTGGGKKMLCILDEPNSNRWDPDLVKKQLVVMGADPTLIDSAAKLCLRPKVPSAA
jgi:hypothetical protein